MLNAKMKYLKARLTSERSRKRSRTLRCSTTGVVLVVLLASIWRKEAFTPPYALVKAHYLDILIYWRVQIQILLNIHRLMKI